MALHFDKAEFARRAEALKARLSHRRLDGVLIFSQESMYWLTGYDTFGFCFFQCLWFGADGRTALLTRSADLRQARHTSSIENIRIWTDSADAEPEAQLRALLDDLGQTGKCLGIEWNATGLTAFHGRRLDAALEDFCRLQDASGLIDDLRAVKSEDELAFVRRAAILADDALDAGLAEIGAAADEGTILAAMQGAVFRGGGDYPGNAFIIGSGEDALLCRYKSGRRRLDVTDQITLEWAGVYRHYHAAMMRTVLVGAPTPRHETLFAAAAEALAACEEALVAGRTADDVFSAHARILDAHGLREHRLAACGYSLGATFAPSWMDPPMFYAGNPYVLRPNMVLFLHMILMDSHSGAAMTLGRTSIVTSKGAQPLSRKPIELLVR